MKPTLKLLAFVSTIAIAVTAPACIGGKLVPGVAPIVSALETAACTIVPIADPATSKFVASACSVAQPSINAVLTGLSAKKRAESGPCRLTPITADGTSSIGEACDSICGDMSSATATDPCPVVDARLRADGVKL